MRLFGMRLLLSNILFLLTLPSVAAQETETMFTLHSNTPVVSHGSKSSDWDGRYTDPGAVFYHDGQFHMFRNGFQAWPASVQIGYLTSPDGLTWTKVSEDPVLMTDDVPFAETAALASSALVEEDGTWVLYFYTWNTRETPPPVSEIGRATADNPLGPWTVDSEPVLRGDEEGWDGLHVDAPSVVRTEAGYRMYYSGVNNADSAIGMATSDDGIHWTKYDDPNTTDAPFAESDPILASDGEDYRYHQPRVERTEDGYVMIFRLQPTSGGNMGLGIATSEDGISWQVVTDEPFWGRDTIPGARGFWWTATALHEDTLFLYIEGGRGSFTDIFVATSMLSFLGD